MISGVALVLLAEATFFGSKPLLIWFLVFFGANAIYIPFVEERSLERRFGEGLPRIQDVCATMDTASQSMGATRR